MSYAYVNSAVIKLSITPLGTPCSYSGTVTGNWTANTASGSTSGSVPINISAASGSGQTIPFGVTQVRCETIKFTFSQTEFTCG